MMLNMAMLLCYALIRDFSRWRDSLLILFEVLIILCNFRIVLI